MKTLYWHVRAIHPPLILVIFGLFLINMSVTHIDGMTQYLVSGLLLIGTLAAAVDGYNRLFEFHNIQKTITPRITDASIHRFLERSRRTWCTRELTKAALGYKLPRRRYLKFKKFYFKRGYYFWNIFPEGSFTRNSPWLKKTFYQETFLGVFRKKKKKRHEKS